ncbi:MAG: DUF962 domain-containing protein [Alphaproteobacteria bacterium]|nr:DUF962 domain-containing protein [Alphaproteobacteria bacterium]
MARRFNSFAEFYPFYLGEHADRRTRRIHFIGSFLVLICLVAAIMTANGWWLLAMPLCGYGFAWIGHFVFEKNHPATFRHPFYSLMGDWVMFWQILTGRLTF